MKDYKIDKSVPLPSERARWNEIPLNDLEVGESIEFDAAKRQRVQSNASRIKKETDKIFTIRTVSKDLCRVWRIQ